MCRASKGPNTQVVFSTSFDFTIFLYMYTNKPLYEGCKNADYQNRCICTIAIMPKSYLVLRGEL